MLFTDKILLIIRSILTHCKHWTTAIIEKEKKTIKNKFAPEISHWLLWLLTITLYPLNSQMKNFLYPRKLKPNLHYITSHLTHTHTHTDPQTIPVADSLLPAPAQKKRSGAPRLLPRKQVNSDSLSLNGEKGARKDSERIFPAHLAQSPFFSSRSL